SEAADYNTMRDGVDEINEVHKDVRAHYESINEQMQALYNTGYEVKTSLGEEVSDAETRERTESEAAKESAPEKLYTVDAKTSQIVPASDEAESAAVLITIDDAPDEN